MNADRRQFLEYLAGSPLLAAAGGDVTSFARALELLQGPGMIASPRQALNVLDFEPVAKARLPRAHWAYLATGTDDDGTVRANRDGYARYQLRMRRLVDTSRVDTSTSLLGASHETPIVVCPVGSQKAFHPMGEVAVARAAKKHVQVLSTVATTSIEEASAAHGSPVWFQLYHRPDWSQTLSMIKRAERAGSPALVFTIDLFAGSNRETMVRGGREDTRVCSTCHIGGQPMPGILGTDMRNDMRKPAIAGLGPGTPTDPGTPTWDYVKRLKDATTMKLFLKGVVTREDAELAMQHGVDGLWISNHGGRAENSLRPTIACVAEVADAVAGRAPVIVDGGIRRGTDIFKALALGATAVGIGRPYIWGLAAFGQEGVETVLDLLRRELTLVMRQAGTVAIPRITRDYIIAT